MLSQLSKQFQTAGADVGQPSLAAGPVVRDLVILFSVRPGFVSTLPAAYHAFSCTVLGRLVLAGMKGGNPELQRGPSNAFVVDLAALRFRLNFDAGGLVTYYHRRLALVAVLSSGAGALADQNFDVPLGQTPGFFREHLKHGNRNSRGVHSPAVIGWRNMLPAMTAAFGEQRENQIVRAFDENEVKGDLVPRFRREGPGAVHA